VPSHNLYDEAEDMFLAAFAAWQISTATEGSTPGAGVFTLGDTVAGVNYSLGLTSADHATPRIEFVVTSSGVPSEEADIFKVTGHHTMSIDINVITNAHDTTRAAHSILEGTVQDFLNIDHATTLTMLNAETVKMICFKLTRDTVSRSVDEDDRITTASVELYCGAQ